MREAVALFLIRDWGLPTGAAASAASAIVHFWDEIGIFVIHGADETVAPRMEVFLDIGDAVQASRQSPDAVAAWVDARIRDRRHEPLILAAALSEAAGDRLLTAACDSGEHELLIAAGAAVHQHARVSDEHRERLVAMLAIDAANPDAQGWTSYVTMLDLAGDRSAMQDPSEVLIHYPPDHRIIGKAAAVLRCSPEAVDERVLLDALRVSRLPHLPNRQPAAGPANTMAHADALHDEVVEAAARRLLGRNEEATRLVVGMLQEVSIGLHRRLLAALRDAGQIDAASDVLAQQSRAFADTTAWLREYDANGEVRVLDHLAQHPRAELTAAQAARLDELAGLYKTLSLHVLGGLPRRQQYASWLEFVDVVRILGDSTRRASPPKPTSRGGASHNSTARHTARWTSLPSAAASTCGRTSTALRPPGGPSSRHCSWARGQQLSPPLPSRSPLQTSRSRCLRTHCRALNPAVTTSASQRTPLPD
ncbi:hypothetical protein [Actinoallomurus liliacearum]|uniref:hypothetical protein n=1 Tax=Actinoallomurus liliacearum TaxID=1080073 RepID=UPI0031F16510